MAWQSVDGGRSADSFCGGCKSRGGESWCALPGVWHLARLRGLPEQPMLQQAWRDEFRQEDRTTPSARMRRWG